MQTNCLHNLNKRFLFAVVIAIVVAAVAFVLASISVLISIIFVLISVSFVLILISFVFLISFLSVVILSALFIFLDLFSDCNIEYICKLKKIETELTIYNSCLILLLYICS